jgi:acyl-CoA reductase-like NAD-dependent aldehyde dehydrogenase
MAAGKPMTSELGNVTPTIVVPGRWSARDIAFQAEHIATQKAHNAGFNCVASQILILPRDWPDGRTLRQRIDAVFALMEQRPEYYPGATQRRTALAGCDSSLRTLLQINEADIEHPAFTSEAFCGVLGYVEIAGAPDEYVRKAVSFANDRLRGTLAANIIVHPERRRSHRSLLDEAVLNLRYGCVGVNAWTGAGYFITETPWGAYPGHTIEDAGSGIGVVHNAYFLERTEKTVVYQPFTPFPRSLRSGEFTLLPKPPWFVLNRNAAEAGRALCDFEMARSPGNALRVARIALRA